MKPVCPILGILLLSAATFIDAIPLSDVTYEDLEEIDGICPNQDNCKVPRDSIDDSLTRKTCHCNSFCSNLGTCCIDSPYRGLKVSTPTPSCRTAFGQDWFQFMVDKCPVGTHADIKQRCASEWDEMDDDIISHLPVTSLSSNMNYKNYFCFRCHENHDEYLYWNLKISYEIQSDGHHDNKDIMPTYDIETKSWMAALGKDGAQIPITLASEIPEQIQGLSKLCFPDVISKCSLNWNDIEMKHKCNAYTSIVNFSRNNTVFIYKNPHCALCNFENLDIMQCSELVIIRTKQKKPFSFTLLLDINRSDGDKVGKIENCDDNSVWDPYFKKCRAFKCALPGHVVKDGKCISS